MYSNILCSDSIDVEKYMNGYVHSKNNLLPPDTLEIKMYLVSRVHCCLALHTVVNGLMFYLRQSFEISIPSLSVCGNASSFEVLSKLSLGPYLNLRAQLLDSWSDTSYLRYTYRNSYILPISRQRFRRWYWHCRFVWTSVPHCLLSNLWPWTEFASQPSFWITGRGRKSLYPARHIKFGLFVCWWALLKNALQL